MDINTNNINILLVEDNKLCRDVVKSILERNSLHVTAVVDAERAMDLIEKAQFDAVVTDIMLPGKNGVELLHHIRKENPDLPVILITGHSSIASAVEAVKLGAQDYILKPLADCERLLNSIRQAVKQYRLTIHNRVLQEQLEKSEKTFRALFHNANDIIFLHTIKDGALVCAEVNNVACHRLGYSREELLSMSLVDITAPEHRAVLSGILKTLAGQNRVTFETMYMVRDGKYIPMEISAHVFDLENSNVVLSIARDVSGRRELEKKIANASERERCKLGHELHDILCQDLGTVTMLSAVLKKNLSSSSPAVQADAAMIQLLSSRSMAFARQLCAGLFPVELEKEGLNAALENFALIQEDLFTIPCSYESDPCVNVTDKTAALNIYRIAQEAVNNSVKHSSATCISISLRKNNANGGVLTITDDGKGFDANSSENGGFGLHIMQYRARMIGAALEISKPGINQPGTQVTCSW